jgi:hypothetical protein
VGFETTANRLWKRLAPADRLLATDAFFAEPPQELVGTALGAVVRARHLRPQVARSLSPAEQSRILATVLEVGEPLASGLLVCLHLAHRRPLLRTFLDAVGLPHEDGLLKEEADPVAVDAGSMGRGVGALTAAYPPDQVRVYLNTLWLQDPERWAALESITERRLPS